MATGKGESNLNHLLKKIDTIQPEKNFLTVMAPRSIPMLHAYVPTVTFKKFTLTAMCDGDGQSLSPEMVLKIDQQRNSSTTTKK